MVLGLLKESDPEQRVALLPEVISDMLKLGLVIWFEKGAGSSAFRIDEQYTAAGGIIKSRSEILIGADILLSIQPLERVELDQLAPGKILISVFQPLSNPDIITYLTDKQLTAFSLDILPRTTRAQSMDILSSMATVAGYKAVLLAATQLPVFFPMFMTAAGTITPAKVLILGAGVAGLQAIATARKLGAVVHVFDVRSAVKEEVMSLGGKFVEVEGARDEKTAGGYAVEQNEDFLQRQRQAIHDLAIKCQVIICTAQIPGRTAPTLIFKDTVNHMTPGSVIVDLAASSGGNCELCINNETRVINGVSIIGNSNLPATMPVDSSRMFGKNVLNFMKLFFNNSSFSIPFDDDIVEATCICHEGDIISPRLKSIFEIQTKS
jgi:NAD(P) transhydrogenase subunit alpha